MEIILCSPTVYEKFGGQTNCTCLIWQGRQSAISTRGGGAQNLHGRCKFVGGGGALTSWAWKWYFQHSQRDISLQKLNLDKVLKKNIFLLEKLPFPPTSLQGSAVPAWEWTIENGIYSGVPNGCFL